MIYLGVDIGGTGIKVGAVTEKCELLYKESAPTQASLGYEVLAKDIADLIAKVMENQNLSVDDMLLRFLCTYLHCRRNSSIRYSYRF